MLDTLFKPKPRLGADPEGRLDPLTRDSWRALLQHPLSVLILTRSQCPWCNFWHDELATFFQLGGAEWTRGIHFGMLALDQPGLAEFKQSNAWIKDEVKLLPYNAIYAGSQMKTGFAGADLYRLAQTIKRVRRSAHIPLASHFPAGIPYF